MKKDMTVKEFTDELQGTLESLKGKSVKDVGIKNLIKEALKENILYNLYDYNLDYEDCEIKTSYLGIVVISFRANYRPDKRQWNGIGNHIDNIEVIVNKDIPLDEELVHVEQILNYFYHRTNFARLEKDYKAKMREVAHLREYMRDSLYYMGIERFDEETQKEAKKKMEEFMDLLNYHNPKVITERAGLRHVKDWIKKWKYDCGEVKNENDDKVILYNYQNQREKIFVGHFLDIPEEYHKWYVMDYFVNEMSSDASEQGAYVLTIYNEDNI